MKMLMHVDLENLESGSTDFPGTYEGAEMGTDQQAWLWAILRGTKPENVLEVGVAAGGTSCLILDALLKNGQGRLWSHDYNFSWYRDKTRSVGFLAESHCQRKNYNHWQLVCGGMCCRHLNGIPSIDLCILDTMHRNPGEHLDILQVLPHMSRNGIVILHDVALHLRNPLAWTTAVALNTLKGRRIPKLPPSRFSAGGRVADVSEIQQLMPNIGGIVLDDDVKAMQQPLFENLSLPWTYRVPENDFLDLYAHFQRHYGKEYADYFKVCREFQVKRIESGM